MEQGSPVQLVYSTKDAPGVVCLGRTKFLEEVRAGRIPMRKIGKRSVFLHEDLLDYVRALPKAHQGPTS